MSTEAREIRQVALYIRVSTAEQARGHSLDSQRDTLRDWADAEGWAVVAVYSDPGASGTSVDRRPRFRRMIADAAGQVFDAVLVLKLDRFARNRGDSAVYRARLERDHVQLLSYHERTDGLSKAAALLVTGLPELLAEHYSVELSEKTTAGRRKRAEKGLPAGDVPFGYVSDGPQAPPRVVPEEAVAIREIFEKYATGTVSILDLALHLNSGGFRPRSKRGYKSFGQDTVRGMLSNRFYVGEIVYKGETVSDGLHEPIVDREFFTTVARVRDLRTQRPRRTVRRPTARPYMLRGIAECASCGRPMWANTMSSGRYRYYRCASRVRGRDCGSGASGLRAEGPEAYVNAMVMAWEQPDDWAELLLERAESDVAGVDHRRAQLEARLQRLRRGLIDGILDYGDTVDDIRECEAQLAILSAAEPTVVKSSELTDIRDLWPLMTIDERREFLTHVLEEVVIDASAGGVVGVVPTADFLPLFELVAEGPGSPIEFVTWRPRPDSNRRPRP